MGQKIKEALARDEQAELWATSLHPEINVLKGNYHYHTLDITMPSMVDDLMQRARPHVLINAAALANVNHCEKEKAECQQVNTEAVTTLIRLANHHKTHLVQISTDFVFQGQQSTYQEDDPRNPVNHYGLAKKQAEDQVMEEASLWSIVRTILVYGYVPELKRNNLVTWVYQSLQQGKPIKVVSDQYRMPTLAEDLAGAIVQIARQEKEGIYHISGREGMSIEQMAQRVGDYFNLDTSLITPVTSAELGEPARRPTHSGFNLFKAEKELGYLPHSFEEGLEVVEQQMNKFH
mgnify:CR=1 FL=1